MEKQSLITLGQFANVLNTNRVEISSDRNFVFFTERYLLNFSRSSPGDYKEFFILKKNQKKRILYAPRPDLKLLQRAVNKFISNYFVHHHCSFGYVPEKSVVHNARKHLGCNWVYNIDIKDFFISISSEHVVSNLSSILPVQQDVLDLILNICFYNNSLPQGAPTSPILSNIACSGLDEKLLEIARKYQFEFSRYADDITFSGKVPCLAFPDFKKQLIKIIESECKFKINWEKENFQQRGQRLIVTGIKINTFPNLSVQYLKDIRFWFFLFDKFGLKQTLKRFEVENPGKNFYSFLCGKINYIGIVRGKGDPLYIKYLDKLNLIKASLYLAESNIIIKRGRSKGTHKQVVTIGNQGMLLSAIHAAYKDLGNIDYEDIVLEVGDSIAAETNAEFIKDNEVQEIKSANAFITDTHMRVLSGEAVDDYVIMRDGKFYELNGVDEIPIYTEELGFGISIKDEPIQLTSREGGKFQIFKVKRILNKIVTKGFNTDLDILFKDKKTGIIVAEIPGYTYYEVTKKDAVKIDNFFNEDNSLNEAGVEAFLNLHHSVEVNDELKVLLSQYNLIKESSVPLALIKYLGQFNAEFTKIYDSVVKDFKDKLEIYSFAKRKRQFGDSILTRNQEGGASKFSEDIELKDDQKNPIMKLSPAFFLKDLDSNFQQTVDQDSSPHKITYIKDGIQHTEYLLYILKKRTDRGTHIPMFSKDALKALVLLHMGKENFDKINKMSDVELNRVAIEIKNNGFIKTKKANASRNIALTIVNPDIVVNLDNAESNDFSNIKIVSTNVVPKQIQTPGEKQDLLESIQSFLNISSEESSKEAVDTFKKINTLIKSFQLDLIGKLFTREQIENELNDFLFNTISDRNITPLLDLIDSKKKVPKKEKDNLKIGLKLLREAFINNEVFTINNNKIYVRSHVLEKLQNLKEELFTPRPLARIQNVNSVPAIKIKTGFAIKMDLKLENKTIAGTQYKLTGGSFYFPLELQINLSESGSVVYTFSAYSSNQNPPAFEIKKSGEEKSTIVSFSQIGPIEFDIKLEDLQNLNLTSANVEKILSEKILESLGKDIRKEINIEGTDKKINKLVAGASDGLVDTSVEISQFLGILQNEFFNPKTQSSNVTYLYDMFAGTELNAAKGIVSVTREQNQSLGAKVITNITRDNISIGTKFEWVSKEEVIPNEIEEVASDMEAIKKILEETDDPNIDFDNIDIGDEGDDFTFQEERTTLGKGITQEEINNELAKVFPSFVKGELFDSLAEQLNILGVNGTPLGIARGLALYLDKAADDMVLHHEIMHVVFNNFMTKAEKRFALNEMRQKYGVDFSAVQVMLDRRGSNLEVESVEAIELYLEELLSDEYATWKIKFNGKGKSANWKSFIHSTSNR